MRRWDSNLLPAATMRRPGLTPAVCAPRNTSGSVRHVRTNGQIKWKGNTIYLSESLKGSPSD